MSAVDACGNVTLTGTNAGQGSTNFSSNVLLGLSAGVSMTGTTLNTFVGTQAAQFLTTQDPVADCSHNTGIGEYSLYGAYNTRNHTLVGVAAGQEVIYGDANIMIGYAAGFKGIAVSNNTFLGNEAGMFQNNAANNVFIGYGTGYRSASAPPSYMYRNVGIGDGVFRQTVSAYNTIAIGVESAMNVSAAREAILIGVDSAVGTSSMTNSILIGHHISPSTISGSILLQTKPVSYTNVSEKLYINDLITGDFASRKVFVNALPSAGGETLNVSGNVNVSGEVYAQGIPLQSTLVDVSSQFTTLSGSVYNLSGNFWNLSSKYSELINNPPFAFFTVSGKTPANNLVLDISVQYNSAPVSNVSAGIWMVGHYCKLSGNPTQTTTPITNAFTYVSGNIWWVHGEVTGTVTDLCSSTWYFNLMRVGSNFSTYSQTNFSNFTLY